jgi:hypothetical protein
MYLCVDNTSLRSQYFQSLNLFHAVEMMQLYDKKHNADNFWTAVFVGNDSQNTWDTDE